MELIVFSSHLSWADSSPPRAKEPTHVCTQIQNKTSASVSRIPAFKLLYKSKLSLEVATFLFCGRTDLLVHQDKKNSRHHRGKFETKNKGRKKREEKERT